MSCNFTEQAINLSVGQIRDPQDINPGHHLATKTTKNGEGIGGAAEAKSLKIGAG